MLCICDIFDNVRRELNGRVGVIVEPGNLIDVMLASMENWTAIADAAAKISKELRRQERAPEGSNRRMHSMTPETCD